LRDCFFTDRSVLLRNTIAKITKEASADFLSNFHLAAKGAVWRGIPRLHTPVICLDTIPFARHRARDRDYVFP